MKILVRGTNWIGDAVMTVPALKELRRVFPDAEITLHTRSWADGLFRDAEFIDELFQRNSILKSKRNRNRKTTTNFVEHQSIS